MSPRHTPLLLALAACGGPPATLSAVERDAHPEPPEILRDVAMIDDEARFTHPYVPGHRTTMDGRVAIRVQGGPPGTQRQAQNLSFWLFAPEKLQEPIVSGPPGAEILAELEPFDVPFPPALDPSVARLGHHALCDPTEPFPRPGEKPNPYTCGEDGLHDCYDLVVLSSTSPGVGTQLWGTDVTVEVASPKTPEARIVDVTLGEPVRGASIAIINEWTEPAITRDGRLLTGRLGRAPRSWTNPETGETLSRTWDLAYAVLPPDAEPCDVTGWTDFHPMSHAPYDPMMKGRYGLAAYPFRDTEGELIPDGEDMGGTYPWVDREGANLFMTGVHGRIVEQSHERFPRRCVHEGCEQFEENTDWDRGFMAAGLWTHGKLVHVDGLINNVDWAVGVSPQTHWEVDLYRTPDGDAVPVRFGGGRFIRAMRNGLGEYPVGYTHNANILDSLQNLPNQHANARPVTPRDVVWIMSSGVATDEIVFDDWLDPNALIVANMMPSITQLYSETGASTSIPKVNNGQVRVLEGEYAILPDYPLRPDEEEDIHVQNAATSLDWAVPAFGRIEAGAARMEPVALGGVEGHGLWLSGDAAVTWEMPEQSRDLDAEDLYLGLFVDPRTPDEERQALLTFPDGTAIHLGGHGTVEYVRDGRVVHTVDLPKTDGWMHLGWWLRAGRTDITLLHDGFALDNLETGEPLFDVEGGTLTLGRAGEVWTGFRGWVDDLKVLAHAPDVEVACNHARGTLVEVQGNTTWGEIAGRYPDWAHGGVAEAAGVDEGVFACVHDHTDDHVVHLQNLPADTVSVRAAVHFPEGPLRADAPRPDSRDNAFCLDCHSESGKGGLTLEALAPGDVPSMDDRRRQPLQPPRRVFGNIPAGWLPAGEGPGSPEEALQAPAEGLVIDRWVLPGGD